MGKAFYQWMVLTNITRALQTSHHLCKNTKNERISDTLFFKHKHITQPTLTPMDRVIKAIGDLTNAIKGTRNVEGIKQIEAIKQLDDLLNKITTSTASVPETSMPAPRVETIKTNQPVTTPRVETPRAVLPAEVPIPQAPEATLVPTEPVPRVQI
jgi:hypothetical protein